MKVHPVRKAVTIRSESPGSILRGSLLSLAIACLMVAACDRNQSGIRKSLTPVSEASGLYWKDISGTGYTPQFVDSFSYNDSVVAISYNRSLKGHFSARLTAQGLKPNFCYQVKLEGKPWGFWVYASDDAANEALGRAGRFWRAQPDPGEASLEEFQAMKDEPGYVFIGSILLDFFVTDDNGNASVDLGSDTSYQMVWKPSQRTPQVEDGPIRQFLVDGETQEIYGQTLPGRGGLGRLTLPAGPYSVQISLTEESFGDPDGAWARVMVADGVTFEIE